MTHITVIVSVSKNMLKKGVLFDCNKLIEKLLND